MMKSIILFSALVALYLATVDAIPEKDKCQCWPGYEHELLDGHWHCRGVKTQRLFECNVPQPPLCRCKVDGKEIVLDLGESHCLSVKDDGKKCENHNEFDQFFAQHPHLRIH